jgi:hypothetical protein
MPSFLRFLRYIVEFVAAFVGFFILLAFLLAWRLSVRPISSDFLTPYIESGIEELVPGSAVHASGSLLRWDNLEHEVTIHADDIKIDNARGVEIADIPSFDARISLFGLLFGQFMPKDLTVDHPKVRVERTKDGAFVFAGVSVGAEQPVDTSSQQPIKDVLRNIAEHLSHAALMHKLAVMAAEIDIHDDQTQKDWAVNVPEISIARNTLQEVGHLIEYGALNGRMIFEVTQKDGTAKLDVHYAYDPKSARHSLSTRFDNLTPTYLAGGHPETLGLGLAANVDLPLNGRASVTLDKELAVESASVQLHGGEGHLIYTDFWDLPASVKALDLQADYDRAAQKMSISNTSIDFGGPALNIEVKGTPSKHTGQDIDFLMKLEIDHLPMNDYGALWPKQIMPNARYWLAANMRDGLFTHGEAMLSGWFAWSDLGNLTIDTGSGKMSAVGGKVTYLDGMPSVTGVAADATFDLKALSVRVLTGGIGNIRIQPFTVDITGLADDTQYIHIPLQVGGPVPEVMKLLDHPPLGYAKKLEVAPDDIQGALQGTVDFRFPLLRTLEMKDVAIKANADATGIASTKLVPGLTIDQGNVALALDMKGFTLKGQANLNKVPFQVNWWQAFEMQAGKPTQEADVTGTVHEDQWPNLGVTLFQGTKGPIDVTFQMMRPSKTHTQYIVGLDTTPAALDIEILNWKKPVGSPAYLKFSAEADAGQPLSVTNITLHGDQIAGSGTATMSADMTQLLALHMPNLTAGRTDAALDLTQSYGDGGAVKFTASGKSLDISGMRNIGGAGKGQPPDKRAQEYHIKLDRLYTGGDGEIDMAQGSASRDAQGWSAIDLVGTVGEGKPLSLELIPQPDGHRTLSITCDDFGDAMKGLGFTDTVRGGKFSVIGASTVDKPRLIVGKATITAFTVVNLPALALLLNATSPFGFAGIVTDSADFSRFEGDFTWQGDDLTLTSAHAAGSAIGINIDGKIDMNTGDANLQGTLVPFSVMNKFINYIPLIGGLITGGDNQGVLAVAYRIAGPLAKPDISVNPVSLLTPGFLRNLFFRDDSGDAKKDDQ